MINRQQPPLAQRPNVEAPGPSASASANEPLVYSRREYLPAIEAMGTTTSCQKTSNPKDYGPDD